MFEVLKSDAASLRYQTLFLKEKERHYLENARLLSGIYNKKHQKGEEKPEMSARQIEVCLKFDDREEKALRDYEKFWGLQHTRKNYVRKLARAVHLALNFLRGTPALAVERKKWDNPDWDVVTSLILENSEEDERVVLQRLAEWRDAGEYPPEGKKKRELRKLMNEGGFN